MAVITKQELEDAAIDAQTLEDVANGDSSTTVVSRLGTSVKSVAKAIGEISAYDDKGAWATTTSYVLKDLVQESGITYICTVAHTSGTFATDLAAGKWGIFQTQTPELFLSSYASLSAAITAIGATEAQLIIDKDDTLTGNITIPSNLVLRAVNGNTLTPAGFSITMYDGAVIPLSLFDSFENAVAALGSTVKIDFVIDKGFTLGASVTIPDNIRPVFNNGPKVTLGTYNLVFQGSISANNTNQLFIQSGAGEVHFTGEQVVVPQWWGAVADGVTDDHSAFQQCADSLISGGRMYIPAGTYAINDHWFIDNNGVHVQGAGRGATVIKVTDWVDGLRVSDSTYPSAGAIVYDTTIEDLTIDGNRSGYTNGPNDTYGNGINLNASDRTTVRNVHIKDVAEQGIVWTYWQVGSVPAEHITIDNCIVSNGNTGKINIGLEGRCRAGKVVNCTVEGASGGNGLYAGHEAGTGTDNEHIIFANNRVQSDTNTGEGIRVTENIYRVNICNNIVDGFDIGIRCSSGDESTFEYLIANNRIENWLTGGIFTFPMKAGDTDSTIINGNYIKATGGATSYGILAVSGAVINGNYVENTTSYGIAITGDGNMISGNKINAGGFAVSLGASTTDNMVSCNYITSGSFENLGATTNIYNNNNTFSSGNGSFRTNAGTPVSAVVPNYLGELLYDTSGGAFYMSFGLTNADWKAI